jgi:3-dehydroquinate dehydratase type I
MICIPIMARNNAEALEKMAEASTFADVLELRLDVMERFDLKEIIESAANPVLVTYRSKREGGEGSADYETRTYYLLDAMEAGADYVDVEFSIPLEWRQKIFQMKGSCGLVVSSHLLNGTPQREKLERIMENMVATGADMVKIVTRARAWEDNFRVLELIPRAQAIGVGIIAFCMGPLGRISRIACPLMGGYMTFASLEKGQESASGQIPARDMKQILEMVSP